MATDTKYRSEIEQANYATVARWVDEASGGFFVADQTPERGYANAYVRIARGDGFVVTGEDGHELSGVFAAIDVPTYRKLDGRNKVTIREVVTGLRFAAANLVTDDEREVDFDTTLFARRYEFARRNGVDK